jgi:mRNA interferase MazF
MKQGEVWLVNLDPTIGAEMCKNKFCLKTRPALVINVDALGKLPLKVIVPITEWKDRYSAAPWMIRIEPNEKNGLSKISSIDCFQIRSLSQERLVEKLGDITSDEIAKVQEGIVKIIGY